VSAPPARRAGRPGAAAAREMRRARCPLASTGPAGARWRPVPKAGDVSQSGLTALLGAAENGDQAAWDALVLRFTNLLWSVARAHRLDTADAGDVVQTTWLRLVENLGRIQDPERLPGWLATTARHECLRTLRRSGREQLDDDPADRADGGDPLDTRLLTEERDAQLWACFGLLQRRCQQLLRVLMADPAPSYAQVAAALDMPVGSIGPTRGRCLERLRAHALERGLTLSGLATSGAGDAGGTT